MHVELVDDLKVNWNEVIYVVVLEYHVIVDQMYYHKYQEINYKKKRIIKMISPKNKFILPIMIHHGKKWMIDEHFHLTN